MADVSSPKRNSANLGRWILTAVLVLGGAGYVFRHSLFPSSHAPEVQAEAAAATGMTVTVVTAEFRKVSRRVVAGGTLIARDEVLVGAEVVGVRIEQSLANVGDQVAEGQLLAVLDGQRLDLLLAQKAADQVSAEASVAQAEALAAESDAASAEAKVVLDRAAALRANGAISAQVFEERETAAATAEARAKAQAQALAVAKAALMRVSAERDELLWQKGQLEVLAPVSGIITERNAKVGQTTAGDGTPLFRIMQDGAVEMEALVVETALPALRVGQTVTADVAGGLGSVEGVVRLISPSVDPETRMGKVWVSLTGKGLKPGSFATAAFATEAHQAIVVPNAAVLAGDAGPQVQVVKDGLVVLRPVRTGLITVGGVEIVAGLEPGEVVIAMAGGFLREGSRVSPVAAVPATAKGDF